MSFRIAALNETDVKLSCNSCDMLLEAWKNQSAAACTDQNCDVASVTPFCHDILIAHGVLDQDYVDARVGSNIGLVEVASAVGLIGAIVGLSLWFRAAQLQPKTLSLSDRLVVNVQVAIFVLTCAAMSSAWVGFDKAAMVEGVEGLDKADYCYTNSPATTLCYVNSYMLGVSTSWIPVASMLLNANAYAGVVLGLKPKTLQAKVPYMIIYQVCSVLIPVSLSQFAAPAGPGKLYCNIRCEEIAIDEAFATSSSCWARLTQAYIVLGINGAVCLVLGFKVYRVIQSHAKNSAATLKQDSKKKGQSALEKASRKIAIFGFCAGTLMVLAFLSRVPSSINPDPQREGGANPAFFVPALAGIFGSYLFAYPKYKSVRDRLSKVGSSSSASSTGSSGDYSK